MQAKSRPWGSGSVIDFPKRYYINAGVKEALKSAGFVPMSLTWGRSWHSAEVTEEQAKRLADSINAGKHDRKQMLYSKKKVA